MSSKILVCTQCGYTGDSKNAIKGSGGVELLLWLFFIIPGLIYSVWRSSSRHLVCPKCKNPNLIPLDSPRARKIMRESMSEDEVNKTIEDEEEKDINKKKSNKRKIIAVIIIFIILFILARL